MRATLLLVFLALAGCESDEVKLNRLQTKVSLARLEVLASQRELEESGGYSVAPDSLVINLSEARDKATLAERDLNRFLRR